MRFVLPCLLAIAVLASRAAAHSWVHCTEASTSLTIKQNSDYSDAKCSGFPRNFKTYVQFNSAFGADTGYNYQPGPTDPICRDAYTSTSYAQGYPMATYSPGQNVRVIWPAKNHDADVCTNPYIPDTTMKLFMDCGLSGTRKPTTNDFLSEATLVVDWKANGGKGFQNCPDFCSNTDKAVCYEDFTVPPSIPVGSTCTFVWYWVFNPGTTPYTSCWEANIVSGSGTGGSTPAPTTASNTPAPTTKAPTKAPTSGGPAPTASTPAPTTQAPTSSSGGGSCSAVWQQCGGRNYNGVTCCTSGNKCVFLSEWYSQCWPNQFDGKAEVVNSSPEQPEHSKTTLILMFLGSAIGASAVVLSVGLTVIYLRRRRSVANSDAAEILIPMQARA